MPSEATKMAKVCAVRRELLAAYEDRVREVMALQNEQITALAGSGDGLERFELKIDHARQRRDNAKQLYLIHVRTHAC